MSLLSAIQVCGSALLAERRRAEITASNLANADTPAAHGRTYARQIAILSASPAYSTEAGVVSGVQVSEVLKDGSTVRQYQPWHPDADRDGYVEYADVDQAAEMADLMRADRSFEMNAAAIQSIKSMISEALEITK